MLKRCLSRFSLYGPERLADKTGKERRSIRLSMPPR